MVNRTRWKKMLSCRLISKNIGKEVVVYVFPKDMKTKTGGNYKDILTKDMKKRTGGNCKDILDKRHEDKNRRQLQRHLDKRHQNKNRTKLQRHFDNETSRATYTGLFRFEGDPILKMGFVPSSLDLVPLFLTACWTMHFAYQPLCDSWSKWKTILTFLYMLTFWKSFTNNCWRSVQH